MSENKKPPSEEETLEQLRKDSDDLHKRIVERQDEEE